MPENYKLIKKATNERLIIIIINLLNKDEEIVIKQLINKD